MRKCCQRGTFSLRNTVECKWDSWDVILCFVWSPKLLETNKLGEVLTCHFNKRKHISSTLCSSFSFVDFRYIWWIFSPMFSCLEYQREDNSQIMPQHHGALALSAGVPHAEAPSGGGHTLTLRQESAWEALSQPSAHMASGTCSGGAGGGTPCARCLQR